MRHPSCSSSMLVAAVLLAAAPAVAAGGGHEMQAATSRANPLLTPSTLPFQAPPFDKIKDSDFQPAFEAGHARSSSAEVEAIADNPARADVRQHARGAREERPAAAPRRAGVQLRSGANTNPTLQKLQEDEAPKLAGARRTRFS